MNPLFIPYLYLAAGLAVLIFCGNWLVTGSVQLARHFKISTLVVGLTIVAYVTSAPEFISSLIATFRREAELSIGNIIGSNFFNITGVLGVTTVVSPVNISNRSLFITDMAWLFGVSIALLLVMIPLSKGKITRWEGGFLLLLFMVYMIILYR